ncbi:oxidoreductase [Williamsoniiplasma somnilux]|uniref:Oxidoreductase n=1 Tax=Williamsoniiplasma somnilux TaxID=215578 RepID=A0A2K8P120_9MOLU|nr:SDR family oxidoreductase [Williamsoniiplasma somnilux]ATZ18701.1 oxidoreductase [Williamsoniiplasma somnilux]
MKKPLVAITGASSGIGKALALEFGQKGYPVLLMARRKELLDELEIANKVTAKVDVTNLEDIQKAVEDAEALYGPVDLMINNAGIMPLETFLNQSMKDKYDTLDVNIKGVVNGMQVVLSGMVERKHGTIMNISSVAGRYTSAEHSLYNGAKFAVNAITEQTRKEVAKDNVRLILIEPGIVDTNLLSTTVNDQILQEYQKRKTAMDNGLTAQEVAQVILHTYELPQHVNLKEIMLTHTKQAI